MTDNMDLKEKMDNMDDLHKYLILLVASNDEPINGRTKLQRMMYLLANKIQSIKEQTSYDSDYCGPYSEIVDTESHYLQEIEILYDKSNRIFLTEIGKEIVKELLKKTDKDIIRALNGYKKFLNDLTSKELLAFMYSAYPSTVDESIECQNIKQEMEPLIISLVEKEKISSQRAAELLKTTQTHVMKKINEIDT